MDPIAAVSAANPIADPAATQDRSARMISEARRLLVQNKISGADAMRVNNMIAMAERNLGSGQIIDARRMAREAVKLAENPNPTLPNAHGEENSEPQPGEVAADGESADNAGAQGSGEEAQAAAPQQGDKTTYQDGSSDKGISFQYQQPISDTQAPFAVRQHELSHVRRETSEAILNGQRVMASVTIRNRIDHETGKPYIAGGRARTIIFPNIETPAAQSGEKLNVKG